MAKNAGIELATTPTALHVRAQELHGKSGMK
jgi:hypothetical protein